MIRRLALVLLALPLVAACGDDGGTYPIDPPGPPQLPSGDYVAAGLPAPFEQDDRVRVSFEKGQVSFQGNCNSLSGEVALENDVLVVDSVGGTEMGCPGVGHEQDEWLVDFFTSRPTQHTLDVGLELRGESGVVRLLPPEAVPGDDDVRLDSVVWQLTGIEETDGDSVSMTPVPDGIVATLDITGTRFRMETGCNTASSTVHVTDDEVRMTGGTLITQRGCPAHWTDQERAQLEVLGPGLTWSIDGDQLRLGNDRIVLLYTAGR